MYEDISNEVAVAPSAGIDAVSVIFALALSVFILVCMWKIFVKAGEPGWAALVPFYNSYVEFKITWGKGWLFLLLLIPLVNIAISIITLVKLAKVFGYGGGMIALLILFPYIAIPVLAFGSHEYVGVE